MIIRKGTRFKLKTDDGMFALRVLRRHDEQGSWECVADAGPNSGFLKVLSRDEIVTARRKYGTWR